MTKTEFWRLRKNDRVKFVKDGAGGVVWDSVVSDCTVAVWVRCLNSKTAVLTEEDADFLEKEGTSPGSLPDGKDGRAILVWPWCNAPEAYQLLSPHGGDEDWVAFVPNGVRRDPMFLDEGTSFGCCSVSEHPVDGGTVRIGAHA